MNIPTITPAALDRDRIKSLVASGQIDEIQKAMDNGHFRRKHRKVAEVDAETYRIHIIATTDTVDRDSERILPRSLEKDFAYYKENPVVLFGHDHSIPAVGKMTDYVFSDEQMKMEIEFAVDEHPLAKMLWGLYLGEYMRMSSIGFIPLEVTDDAKEKLEGQNGLTYIRNELIELSLVNVGSNRHALADLPASIKSDPTLRRAYEQYIEAPETLAVRENALPIAPNEKTLIQIPESHGNLPLHLHLNVGGGSEDETTTEQETSETMAQKKSQKCPNSDKKQSRLVRLLNKLVDTSEHRATRIQEIADEALITTDMVEQALKGEFTLDGFELQAFAEILGVAPDLLEKSAASDATQAETSSAETAESAESETTETDADDADDDDDADNDADEEFEDKATDDYRAKFYSLVGQSFEGSYEARQAAVYHDLEDYLEYKIGTNEYGYVDFSVLATYDDHVIVRNWDDGNTYKATYTIDADGEVEFTDLVAVRIVTTYEEIEDADEMPMAAD